MRFTAGMTVVELIVVMAIVASIMGIATWSLTSIGGSSVRSEALRLSTAIKYTYSQAAINNVRYRMVFDIESGSYYTEVAEGTVLTEESSEEAEEEFLTEEARELGEQVDEKNDLFSDEEENPFGVNRKITYARVQDGLVDERSLKDGVRFDRIVTAQAEEPIDQGKAAMSFFANGFQEKVMIFLRDESGAFFTLETEPLTGRVHIYSEEREVPDDFGEVERDD